VVLLLAMVLMLMLLPVSSAAASTSSVVVKDEAKEVFKAMKLRRKHKFLILVADPATFELSVETAGGPTDTLDTFLSLLPSSDCRYAFYDHAYTSADGRPCDSLFFIFWAPPTANPSSKMFHASHRSAVSKLLNGTMDVRASSLQEIKVAVGVVKDDEDEGAWDPDA